MLARTMARKGGFTPAELMAMQWRKENMEAIREKDEARRRDKIERKREKHRRHRSRERLRRSRSRSNTAASVIRTFRCGTTIGE